MHARKSATGIHLRTGAGAYRISKCSSSREKVDVPVSIDMLLSSNRFYRQEEESCWQRRRCSGWVWLAGVGRANSRLILDEDLDDTVVAAIHSVGAEIGLLAEKI